MQDRETLTLDTFEQPQTEQSGDVYLEPTQEQVEQVEPQSSSNAEEEARKLGWKSAEEYKGDEKYWVPADEFLHKVETDLATQNGVIRRQLRQQEKQAKEHQETIQRIVELHKKDREEAAEKARQQALDDVRKKHKDAVVNGDVEEAEKYAVEAAQYYQPQVNPNQEAANRWLAENQDWYNKAGNEAMTAAMNGLHDKYLQQGYSFVQALDMAGQNVKQEFKQRFTPEPKRANVSPPAAMISPQARKPVSDPYSVSNLTNDAREEYKAFMARLDSLSDNDKQAYSKMWLDNAKEETGLFKG